MLILRNIVCCDCGCFVSGLLSNLCCRRSSVAAVVAFFFNLDETSQGEECKLKNNLFLRHVFVLHWLLISSSVLLQKFTRETELQLL